MNKLYVAVCFAGCLLAGCASQEHKNPLLPNANELSFRDFYKSPVGPRGLEPTDQMLQLNGKRIHIQGHMVKEEEPTAGLFLLTSMPVNIPEKEDGPSDDLPGSTIFVHMPQEDAEKKLAYRPGLWDLTGTLQLGPKEEANGRVSYVRLLLDSEGAETVANSEQAQTLVTSKP